MWIKTDDGYLNLMHTVLARLEPEKRAATFYPLVEGQIFDKVQRSEGEASYRKAERFVLATWCDVGDGWHINVDRYSLAIAEPQFGTLAGTLFLADGRPGHTEPERDAARVKAIMEFLAARVSKP